MEDDPVNAALQRIALAANLKNGEKVQVRGECQHLGHLLFGPPVEETIAREGNNLVTYEGRGILKKARQEAITDPATGRVAVYEGERGLFGRLFQKPSHTYVPRGDGGVDVYEGDPPPGFLRFLQPRVKRIIPK